MILMQWSLAILLRQLVYKINSSQVEAGFFVGVIPPSDSLRGAIYRVPWAPLGFSWGLFGSLLASLGWLLGGSYSFCGPLGPKCPMLGPRGAQETKKRPK